MTPEVPSSISLVLWQELDRIRRSGGEYLYFGGILHNHEFTASLKYPLVEDELYAGIHHFIIHPPEQGTVLCT